jgi:hypothetical protein
MTLYRDLIPVLPQMNHKDTKTQRGTKVSAVRNRGQGKKRSQANNKEGAPQRHEGLGFSAARKRIHRGDTKAGTRTC